MKNIYDFPDYVTCVERQASLLNKLQKTSGNGQMGCHKEAVCMVELRVGEAKMYFKQSFNDSDFN